MRNKNKMNESETHGELSAIPDKVLAEVRL